MSVSEVVTALNRPWLLHYTTTFIYNYCVCILPSHCPSFFPAHHLCPTCVHLYLISNTSPGNFLLHGALIYFADYITTHP